MASLSVDLTNDSGLPPEEFDALCNEIFDLIVSRTPVDTGNCQAAWQIYFSDENTCEISNSVDYVSYLEDGWSKQAPNGMVQITLDEISDIKSSMS